MNKNHDIFKPPQKVNGVLWFGYDRDMPKKYKVSSKVLGKGQFGTTRLCSKKGDDSHMQYAVKSVKKSILKDTESIKDLQREVAIMQILADKQNIVHLFEVFEDNEAVHMVMECCKGGELFDRIVAKGSYSEKDAATVIRDMLQVVAECHLAGVMHRDLKPENFLYLEKDEDSPLKATDFGLSEFFEDGKEFRDLVGSAYYVAPEVLKRKYSCEADIWSIGVIMFILLSGVPPFWASTDTGIFKEIIKPKMNIKQRMDSDPAFRSISASAKDLIQKMLCVDRTKRLSAAEALSHPWVQKDGDAPATALDHKMLSKMKKFSAYSKVQKKALKHLACTFENEEEVEHLRHQFDLMDADKDGSLTYEEMLKALKLQGTALLNMPGISEDQVMELLQSMDNDNSGTIDYQEFLAATLHVQEMIGSSEKEDSAQWRNRTLSAFKRMDTNGDGFIDASELQKDGGMDEEECAQAIKELDANGDGLIDYPEFCALLRTLKKDPTSVKPGV